MTPNQSLDQQESSFDPSKYIRNKPTIAKTIPEEKPFEAGQYKRAYQPTDAERAITRTGSRAGETLLGFPGNFRDFAKTIGNVLGGPEDKEKLDKTQNFLRKGLRKGIETLPTSQELKELSKKQFGLWTTAQGEKEELGDEAIETLTNLMIPIGGQQGFWRSLAASVFGTGAKKAAKEFGAPEWAQEATKIGTLLGVSMFNPGGARNYSDNLYHLTDQLLPPGSNVSVPSGQMVNNLTALRANLAMGAGQQSRGAAPIIQWIDNILDHIAQNGGRLNVKEGQAFSRNINEAMGDPANLRRARELFPVLGREVRDTMSQIQATHPEYWNAYQAANESHATIQQSQRIGNAIENQITKSPLRSRLGAVMAVAGASYLNPLAGVGAAGTYGMVRALEIANQIIRSPTLRGYFGRVVQAAANDNKAELAKSLKKFDEEALKEERKQDKKPTNRSKP